MDIARMLASSDSEWTARIPNPIAGSKLPDPILGDEEAAVEWDNGDRAKQTFVRLDTYDDMRNPRALFLFGRRGTGKTTYLRMLDHEVKNRAAPPYASSCLLQSQQLILGMSAQIRSSPLAELPDVELAEALIPVWTWVITIAAMQATLSSEPARFSEPVEVKRLRAFLNECLGPATENMPQDRIRDRMHDLLVSAVGRGQWTSPGGAVSSIGRMFADEKFDQAASLLAQILAKRPALVMLDAGDVYSVLDPIPNAVITSLIASLTRFTTYRHGKAIFAKAAFPSEILPHLYPYNRGKMQSHIVIISWTYRDLVSLLAKRFALYRKPAMKDAVPPGDLHRAQSLVYSTLPAEIQTRVGIAFDTLAYIIRHTQRTPRQVVMLVNSILTHALRVGWIADGQPMSTEMVVKGVHYYLGHLVNDSIDMHRSIYQRLDEIVQRSLAMRPCYFPASDLNKFVKEVSDVRHTLSMERIDIVRILFEVGAVGIAHNLHRLSRENSTRFILEALFEYQVKQTLTANIGSYCVIHPMFYEWLGTKVDATKFVYPVAFEDAERSVLAQYGFVDASR